MCDHISTIVMTLSLSFTKIKMKTFPHNITQSMDPSPPWPDGEVGLGGSRLRKQDLILQWRTRGIWGLSGEECAQGMEEWGGGSGECSPGMEEHGCAGRPPVCAMSLLPSSPHLPCWRLAQILPGRKDQDLGSRCSLALSSEGRQPLSGNRYEFYSDKGKARLTQGS